MVADPHFDLSAFRRIKVLRASKGGNGLGGRKHGADGETVGVRVPVGTQILDPDGGSVSDLDDSGHAVRRRPRWSGRAWKCRFARRPGRHLALPRRASQGTSWTSSYA